MIEPLSSPGEQAVLRSSQTRRIQTVALIAFVYLGFSILLPLHRFNFDRIPPLVQALLIVVPTIVFMLLQLLFSQSIVRLKLSLYTGLGVAIFSLALWFAILFLVHPMRGMPLRAILPIVIAKGAVEGMTLTLSLTCFGAILSRIVRERNLLLPVALIAMPIDFLGAMTSSGFTHDMVKHAPRFVSSVSVSVPAITSQTAHGLSLGPIAFIGPGDVLFMALFFAAVQRFEMDERATFNWMYGLLTLSMVLVVRLPNFEVGALVPMGLAVIIANGSQMRLKRDEIFAVAYAGILVLAIVGIFFWSSHRYLFHAH